MSDLVSLKNAISVSERRLVNLKVIASTVTTQWNPITKSWEPYAQKSITAWYCGLPGSKAKVQVDNEVVPWTGGTAPFLQHQFDVAFDGKAGYFLDKGSGPQGKTIVRRSEGTIEPDRPTRVQDLSNETTGWGYSLYGILDFAGARLSDLIPTEPGTVVTVSEEKSEDIVRIRIIAHNPSGSNDEYDLDPARAYALVQNTHTAKDGALERRLTVTSFFEPVSQVFYPREATWENFVNLEKKTPPGEPYIQTLFTATQVVANDSAFTDDNFHIAWPAGTRIEDHIAGLTYNVSDSDSAIKQQMDSQLKTLFTAAATAPSMDPSLSSQVAGNSITAPENPKVPEHSSGAWMDIAGIVIVSLAAAGFIVWRLILTSKGGDFKPKLILVSMLVFLSAASKTNAQTLGMNLTPQYLSGAWKAYNCGLNATSFVLARFDRQSELLEVGDRLNLDTVRVRPVDMAAIKRVLENAGLQVEATKDTSFEDIAKEVQKGSVCIAHLQGGSFPDGHFVVFGASSRYGLYLVDCAKSAGWLSISELTSRLGNVFTGYCLFVSNPPPLTTTAPEQCYSLDEQRIDINIGTRSSGDSDFVVDVPVSVHGNLLPQIELAKGSCNCFKKAYLIQSAAQSSQLPLDSQKLGSCYGRLQLVFNATALGSGHITKSILLQLSGTPSRNVVVNVMGDINDQNTVSRIRWFPHVVDFGIVEKGPGTTALSVDQQIVVAADKGIQITPENTDSTIQLHSSLSELSNAGTASGSEKQVHVYTAHITPAELGAFHDTLRFTTNDPAMPVIIIPIRGEVVFH